MYVFKASSVVEQSHCRSGTKDVSGINMMASSGQSSQGTQEIVVVKGHGEIWPPSIICSLSLLRSDQGRMSRIELIDTARPSSHEYNSCQIYTHALFLRTSRTVRPPLQVSIKCTRNVQLASDSVHGGGIMAFVKTICSAMERIAPLRLAESWDNVAKAFIFCPVLFHDIKLTRSDFSLV